MAPVDGNADRVSHSAADDEYGLSEPGERQEPSAMDMVPAYVRARLADRPGAPPPLPSPPKRPMLEGTLIFPWYPCALLPWVVITAGMVFSGYLLMVLWGPAAKLGGIGLRAMGPPAYVATLMTLAYACTCAIKVIEETSHGLDSVECEPDLNWKEWFYSFAYIACLLLQAGAVGMLVRAASLTDSWLPMSITTLVLFPWFLLGGLAADGAWVPLAVRHVMRTFPALAVQWGFFYLQTGAIALVWTLVTVGGLATAPWLVPLYSGPILAAGVLVYARLVGRMAWCIANELDMDDDDL